MDVDYFSTIWTGSKFVTVGTDRKIQATVYGMDGKKVREMAADGFQDEIIVPIAISLRAGISSRSGIPTTSFQHPSA